MTDKELIAALIMIIASLLEGNGETLEDWIKKHSNLECVTLIDQWVKSERKRYALKRHYLDGIPTEMISEEIDRSPRQTARIIKQAKTELSGHI